MIIKVCKAWMIGTVAALALSGCSEDPAELAARHFESASKLYAKRDLRGAVVELKSTLQADPNHAAGRHMLGQIYLLTRNGAAARKELLRAKSLGTSTPDLDYDIALATYFAGDFAKLLQSIANQDGARRDARWLTLMGDASLATDDRDTAREAYSAALELDRDNVRARRGMARLKLADGKPHEAAGEIAKAVRTFPDDHESWVLKGELEMSLSEFVQAQSSFERALKLADTDAAASLGLARALLAQDRVDAADSRIAPLAKAAPDEPQVNYVLALVARKRNDLNTADKRLRDVLAVAPRHAAALLLLGQVKYLQRQFAQAADALSQHLSAKPDSTGARKLLGAIHLELKDPEAALRVLAPLEKRELSDPHFLSILGATYMAKGDTEKGSRYLSRAAKGAPETAPIRTQLAVSHLATGDVENAISELQAAIVLDPTFSRADVLLILTHLRSRNFETALEAAEELAGKKPDAPAAHNLLGATLEGTEDRDAARSAYEKARELDPGYLAATLNLARMALQDGDKEIARTEYEKALLSEAGHPVALVALAKLASDSGDVTTALRLLNQARSANTKALEPRLVLGNYYLRRNDTVFALELASEATRIAPRRADALLLLGRAQLASRQIRRAITTLTELARAQSEWVEVRLHLARAHGANRDTDAARRELGKVLEIDPNNLRARAGLAALDIQVGRTERERALQVAKELQKIRPEAAAGFVLEGDARLASGERAKAIGLYEQALKVQANTSTLLKLYGALRRAEKQTAARELLGGWLGQNPKDAAARVTFAADLHQAGDIGRATQEYETVLNSEPGSVLALNNLAWLYHENRDPRALELAERAYNALPQRPEIMDTYGWLLVESGKVERGLKLLQPAAERAPDNADIAFHYAAALARAGDKFNAREILENLLSRATAFSEREAAEDLLKTL